MGNVGKYVQKVWVSTEVHITYVGKYRGSYYTEIHNCVSTEDVCKYRSSYYVEKCVQRVVYVSTEVQCVLCHCYLFRKELLMPRPSKENTSI